MTIQFTFKSCLAYIIGGRYKIIPKILHKSFINFHIKVWLESPPRSLRGSIKNKFHITIFLTYPPPFFLSLSLFVLVLQSNDGFPAFYNTSIMHDKEKGNLASIFNLRGAKLRSSIGHVGIHEEPLNWDDAEPIGQEEMHVDSKADHLHLCLELDLSTFVVSIIEPLHSHN